MGTLSYTVIVDLLASVCSGLPPLWQKYPSKGLLCHSPDAGTMLTCSGCNTFAYKEVKSETHLLHTGHPRHWTPLKSMLSETEGTEPLDGYCLLL